MFLVLPAELRAFYKVFVLTAVENVALMMCEEGFVPSGDDDLENLIDADCLALSPGPGT